MAQQLDVISSKIIDRIQSLGKINNKPILIAIDGGSGSGKSTIAGIVAKQLNATLIATDDFYAAEIPHDGWVNRSSTKLLIKSNHTICKNVAHA